jgi:hypothetical protein
LARFLLKTIYLMNSIKLPPQLAGLFKKNYTDVVGIELGSGLSGVPAVRLVKGKQGIEVKAIGILDLLDTLPQTPDVGEQDFPIWSLPKPFCSPHAALTVTSKLSFLRHTSGANEEIPEKKKYLYRDIRRAFASDMPELVAGLPDFQAEWAAHLFPEGHAPTASSLQISQLAIMNSMNQHPTVKKAEGSSIALFIGSNNTTLVALQNRIPVLYREYPLGSSHVQQEVSSKMQLSPILVQQLLEEDAMDAAPYFEPILKPLIRQVEIMNDYLSRRRNAPASNFFISGALVGPRYWNSIFSKMIGKELTYCRPFEGLPLAKDAVVMPEKLADVESLFACAAGAALALLETL